MQHLEVSGVVVLYIGRTVSKGSIDIRLFFYIIPVSLYTFFPPFWNYECSLAIELVK
jgi:hypothetical protein